MAELDGRVALVTGAGSGIGRGISRVLAREGADLVLTDIGGALAREAAEEVGGIALEHDVTSWSSCEEVVKATLEAKGRIDLLVNNAGVSRSLPFHEIDEAEWDSGQRRQRQRRLPLLPRGRAAHDGAPIRGDHQLLLDGGEEAIPFFVHYCASKFAVIGLTQGLAKELAEYNVNVNAVCPGVVRTPLWDPLLDQISHNKGISREKAWQDSSTASRSAARRNPRT